MKKLELSWEEFIPIQSIGVYPERLAALSEKRDSPIPPVTAVAYSGRYLLLDGNHRAYFGFINNKRTPTEVLETDKELSSSGIGSLIGCRTIEDVVKKYETVWKLYCERENIISIADYRINPPPLVIK